MSKQIALVLIGAFLFVSIIAYTVIAYIYSQQYVQDSETSATKGIFFTTTLNLEAYDKVSSGRNMLGKFERYSRSDRHIDVLTIYCKKYCEEQ